MRYQQDISDCMYAKIGEAGLTQKELEQNFSALSPAVADLGEAYRDQSLPLLCQPELQDDLEQIAEIAHNFRLP